MMKYVDKMVLLPIDQYNSMKNVIQDVSVEKREDESESEVPPKGDTDKTGAVEVGVTCDKDSTDNEATVKGHTPQSSEDEGEVRRAANEMIHQMCDTYGTEISDDGSVKLHNHRVPRAHVSDIFLKCNKQKKIKSIKGHIKSPVSNWIVL